MQFRKQILLVPLKVLLLFSDFINLSFRVLHIVELELVVEVPSFEIESFYLHIAELPQNVLVFNFVLQRHYTAAASPFLPRHRSSVSHLAFVRSALWRRHAVRKRLA